MDVGEGQIHASLRENMHVFSYEKTDIRNFRSDKKYDFIVCDASFISLEKIFQSIFDLANKNTEIILLFKPQFEVGRELLTKNGVPKSEEIIQKSLQNFKNFLQKFSVSFLGCEKSTLIGEAGNQEYIFYLKKSE